ncbi:hypothetical protein PC123_g25146 [Phytophthora cactorum]|nr:hypothetical protein PC120_g24662 [Phytophthora cactorum]KAG4039298.1 hypothetical protein PC123_g25146 [Phytophthora cactorum]
MLAEQTLTNKLGHFLVDTGDLEALLQQCTHRILAAVTLCTCMSYDKKPCEDLLSPVRNPWAAFDCHYTIHLFQSDSQAGTFLPSHRLCLANVIQRRKNELVVGQQTKRGNGRQRSNVVTACLNNSHTDHLTRVSTRQDICPEVIFAPMCSIT